MRNLKSRLLRLEGLFAQSEQESECWMCNAYSDDPHRQFGPHECMPANLLPALLYAINHAEGPIPAKTEEQRQAIAARKEQRFQEFLARGF